MGKRTRKRKASETRADIRKVQPAGAQLQLEHPDDVAADDDMHPSDLLEPQEYDRGEFEMVGQHNRFDGRLMGRARSYWRFGEWAQLAAIPHDDLEPHPERTKLALLVAAGHQQLANLDEARRWGCGERLDARNRAVLMGRRSDA